MDTSKNYINSQLVKKSSILLSFFLIACGGGGTDTSGSGSNPPSTNTSFTVTALSTGGGSISPSTRTVVNGQATTFTLTADSGNSISSISGCNGTLIGNIYTTGVINSACTVNVIFIPNLFAPNELRVTSGDETLVFNWQSVTGATSYNIYLDTSPNIDPKSYSTNSSNAIKRAGVISPFEFKNLNNDIRYYAVVTAVAGIAESPASNEVSASPQKPFVALGVLNDTGTSWCATNDNVFVSCPATGFEGQDGDTGRDSKARSGLLTKIGSGSFGFDYTKLGHDGKPLDIQDREWDENGDEADGSSWNCVRDNVTGLIWEVKSRDGGLRDTSHTYTMYNPSTTTNGGFEGVQNGGNCNGSLCDTNNYVLEVNKSKLCGFSDWRLPTEVELVGLIQGHFETGRSLFQKSHFPTMHTARYWTSVPSTRSSFSGASSYVDFRDTTLYRTSNDAKLSSVLVRSDSPSPQNVVAPSCRNRNPMIIPATPSSDFIINNDGTVTHSKTRLMWMRCSLGQMWNGQTCTGTPSFLQWEEALKSTRISYAGYNDWRLPNRNELLSIRESSCWQPSINEAIFPNHPISERGNARGYWTSSPAPSKGLSWFVDFNNGNTITVVGNVINSANSIGTRLVRDAH